MKTSGQNQPGKKKVRAQKSGTAGAKQVRGKAQRKAAEKFSEEKDPNYDGIPTDTIH